MISILCVLRCGYLKYLEWDNRWPRSLTLKCQADSNQGNQHRDDCCQGGDVVKKEKVKGCGDNTNTGNNYEGNCILYDTFEAWMNYKQFNTMIMYFVFCHLHCMDWHHAA